MSTPEPIEPQIPDIDDPSEPHHNLDVVGNPRTVSAATLHQEAIEKARQNPKKVSAENLAKTNAPDRHIGETGGEDLTLIVAEQVAAEDDLDTLFKEYDTYDNPLVLAAAIRVLESWIGLYKLQSMDELINKIELVALQRYNKDNTENFYIKTIQLKAFLRFKQHRFQDALDLFISFKDITGSSPELLENMGHTYNSLGQDKKAVECFKEAIDIQNNKIETVRLIIKEKIRLDREDQEEDYRKRNDSKGKPELSPEEAKQREDDEFLIEQIATERITLEMGGLLLGLATSLKKQGELQESLIYLDKALSLYKKRFNDQDHSLIAKTLSSVSDVCTRMKNHLAALEASTEAVRIFKKTCGVSPLTANALQGLGDVNAVLADKVLDGLDESMIADLTQPQRIELVAKNWFYTVQSVLAYDEAFELHCQFDTPEYNQIIRLIQSILDTKTKLLDRPFPTPSDQPLSLQTAMAPYLPSIKVCLATITLRGLDNTDEGAVLKKSFGEVVLLGGDFKYGVDLLFAAKTYFKSVTNFDCSSLVTTCNGLIEAGIQCAKRDNVELTHDVEELLA